MAKDCVEQVRDALSQEELLCQLAEEASELAQAALKLRRVYDGTNPTPKKRSEAFDNLLEEIADVYLVSVVLDIPGGRRFAEIMRIATAKAERWASRLEQRGENGNGEK